MSLTFIAALFALPSLVAQAPDISSKVTLQATESVAALLKDLSARTGVGLSTNPQRGKEILIVSLEDVPLSEALDRIAWTTYGRWEKGSGGFRLVRDADAEKAAERKYVAWHKEEIQNAIEGLRTRVLKQGLAPEPDRTWCYPPEPERESQLARSMDRALAQALSEVKPETLAFTRYDKPCVYSDAPTQAEYPFRDGAREVLRIYNKGPRTGEAVHVLLKCDYRFGSGTVRLNFYDQDGTPIDFVRAVIRPDSKHAPTRSDELADQIPPEATVPLSEPSRAFLRTASTNPFYPFGSPLNAAPNLVTQLQNPERFEPLGTFVTDVWIAVARWKHRNLVANIDDTYLFPYWASTQPKLREAFQTAGGYNAELSPGWIVARPSLASPPWQHRIDREALGRFVRRTAGTGLKGLLEQTDFAGALAVPPDAWMVRMYVVYAQALAPELGEDWHLPRLLGTMSEEQRTAWFSGQSIPIRALPDPARFALSQLVTPTYEVVNFSDEPTHRFPGGAQQEGYLDAKINRWDQCYFRIEGPKGQREESVTLVKDFGAYLREQAMKRPEVYSHLFVRFGIDRSLQLGVTLAGGRHLQIGTFYLPSEDQKEYVPWSQVPLEVRNRIVGS